MTNQSLQLPLIIIATIVHGGRLRALLAMYRSSEGLLSVRLLLACSHRQSFGCLKMATILQSMTRLQKCVVMEAIQDSRSQLHG